MVKESLACNVPFVSTDVSDLADIAAIEPACVVAAPDSESLASGILAVLDASSSGTLCGHVESMSLPNTAERLIRIYQELLEVPGRLAA